MHRRNLELASEVEKSLEEMEMMRDWLEATKEKSQFPSKIRISLETDDSSCFTIEFKNDKWCGDNLHAFEEAIKRTVVFRIYNLKKWLGNIGVDISDHSHLGPRGVTMGTCDAEPKKEI